jgi:ketosteroid isomerase-like protein
MSAENVELIRRVYERFNRLGRLDPAEVDAAEMVPEVWNNLDPEFELVQPDYLPDASIFHGADGAQRFLRTIADIWIEVRWEPEEFVDAGDAVLVRARLVGLARRGGAPFETDETGVWRFRDGRIVRLEGFRDYGEARAAVGLEPEGS